jgi:hypothetical protein
MLSVSFQRIINPTLLASLACASYNYFGARKIGQILASRHKTRYYSTNQNPAEMVVNFSPSGSIFETLSTLNTHGLTIKYPQIVCVGNQSSGKTSLTEAICGINGLFEKKTGMATRRPTSISLIKTAEGPDQIKIGHLGEKTQNINKARQRLNEENDGEVTDKPLDIVIYSPKINKECQFIDLPGYIRATKLDEDSTLPAKIRKICKPYIDDSTNIKMVVMSATEDAASSEGLAQIIKYQQLANSMAIFTKIDMITNDKIQTRALMGLLNDKSYIPQLGAVGVRLRSQSDLDSGITIEKMLQNEQAFIKSYNLTDKKVNVGIPRLMEMISGEQMKRISHNFPAIKEQIGKLLNEKKQGHSVIRRLMETDDIHGISVELERIITDLHPLSPMRKSLEKSIFQGIRGYVRDSITSYYQFQQGANSSVAGSFRVINGKHHINLNMVRCNFNHKVNPDHMMTSDRLTENLLYGECGRDLSIPELENASNTTLAKGLLGAFVRVVHPVEVLGEMETSTYNRVQFTRDINQLISSVVSPDFTKSIVSLTTSEIKNFVIKNAQSSDNNGVAELFFVHIFDKIAERAGIEELRNSIRQMTLRESRPYVKESDLISHAYQRLRNYDQNKDSVMKSCGFFQTDTYPVGIDMYSPQMRDAYVDELIVRMSADIYRLLGFNLLNRIIADTIEMSLKTVKRKDFSKEEKGITDAIQLLEKQLISVENAIEGKTKV